MQENGREDMIKKGSPLTHMKRLTCHLQYGNGQNEVFVSNLHGKRCP